MKRRLAALSLLSLLSAFVAGACNLLVGNAEPTLATDAAAPDAADSPCDDAGCDASRGPPCIGDCEAHCDIADSCGACGHTCLGGACDGGRCQPTVFAADQHIPSGLAVDPDPSGYVYWTLFQLPGRVLRKKKSGPAALVEVVYNPASSTGETPTELAIDATRVYWTSNDFGGTYGSIHWANKDGADHHGYTLGGFGAGIAVDSAVVYWMARGPGAVWRMPKGGNAASATTLFLEPPGGGRREGFDVAVEPGVSGVAFWTDAQSMNRVGKDGSDLRQLSPTYPPAYGGPLAIVDQQLFFTGPTGRMLMRTDQDYHCPGFAACPQVLATAAYVFGPQHIVIDGPYVYWGNNGDGRIVRCKRDGSEVTVLAVANGGVYGFAVDATSIYWTVQYSQVGTTDIWRLAK